MTTAVSMAVALALTAWASGCTESYDTTQVDAVKHRARSTASTTSIVVETVPTTTTIAFDATTPPVPALPDVASIQATLSQLVGGFALDPQLLAQIQGLANPDLSAIAGMFDIDLSALDQLGMTVAQISSLGETVARSGEAIIGQLVASAMKDLPVDPGTLVGLLTGSVDINGIAQGAVASIVDQLANSLLKTQIQVSPQLTIQLNEILEQLDPQGLGQISADPSNASFIALITSVVLSANPLLTDQLLENPLLDEKLKDLLVSLQQLNANLGETASAAILSALKALFPDLAGL